MEHSTPSPTLTLQDRCGPPIRFHQCAQYLTVSQDLIMQKMVRPQLCTPIADSYLFFFFLCPGKPTSEMRRAGQPPRILSIEEQEKMRTVCRVCSASLLSFEASFSVSRILALTIAYRNVFLPIVILNWWYSFGLQKLSREVLDIAAAAIRPGITTDAIDAIVHDAIIERKAYPSPLNYRNFPKSVCTCVCVIVA